MSKPKSILLNKASARFDNSDFYCFNDARFLCGAYVQKHLLCLPQHIKVSVSKTEIEGFEHATVSSWGWVRSRGNLEYLMWRVREYLKLRMDIDLETCQKFWFKIEAA